MVDFNMISDDDMISGKKWIQIVLKELKEATTTEIIERVRTFNQDCADRIPMVLSQMRMEGKIISKVVAMKNGTRKNIIWQLTNQNDI